MRQHANWKNRLSEAEIIEVRQWIESSPPDKKPSIRTIAKRYNRSRPAIIKSLGGWNGIQRNRPIPPPKPMLRPRIDVGQSPTSIEPFTQEIEDTR